MDGSSACISWIRATGRNQSQPNPLPCGFGAAAEGLLPLNRPERLRRDVVDHAVDAPDLVDDAGRGLAEELVVEVEIVRRHAVGRGDGAQGTDAVIGPGIAHDADRLDRQEHGEGLPDRVVKSGIADLFEIDRIGLAQDVGLVAGDLAGHADRMARPRERLKLSFNYEDLTVGKVPVALSFYISVRLIKCV